MEKNSWNLLQKSQKHKPIVLIKAGEAHESASSCVAYRSLAPEDAVFTAACKQAGIIVVESIREFFNMAKLFELGIMEPLQNLIVSQTPAGQRWSQRIWSTCHVPFLDPASRNTKDKLRKVLPPMAAVNNPVDIIGDALSDRYETL